jgi:hypothetical protein
MALGLSFSAPEGAVESKFALESIAMSALAKAMGRSVVA